jgi:hypothetical protein
MNAIINMMKESRLNTSVEKEKGGGVKGKRGD